MTDYPPDAGPYELDDDPLDGPPGSPGPDPHPYDAYESGADVYESGAASPPTRDEPVYESGAASPPAREEPVYDVGSTAYEPAYESGAVSSAPPPRRSWVVPALVLLVMALLGLGLWWKLREAPPEPPAEASRTAEAPADGTFDAPRPEAPPAAEPVEAEPIELPPLNASDEAVRRLVEELSAHPRLAAFLASDNLVRRFVGAVSSVAEGDSPKTHVPFLAPEGAYAARQAGGEAGRAYASEAAYQRYDRLAAVAASLDTEGTARLYRQLEPLMDEAYAELGYPGRTFDDVLARAMGRVLAVPVSDEPAELRRGVVSYRYKDPALEALPEAEKHLLRMGPANLRRVQAKVRELAAATGIRPVGPASR